MHFDEVCYDFPELRIVMRHGAEPWEALAVKLMLKWPNLYYMTERVRAQVLPEGDHRLRQHARRRQGHVRGLLPDGAEPRAHLHRDAERAVPRPRVAEVPPRERDARVQARRERRREARPAPDRLRGQRPRRGGDRRGRRGAARRRRPRCASARTCKAFEQGVAELFGKRRGDHVQLRARRRCTSRWSCSDASPATRSITVGGDVLDRHRAAGARRASCPRSSTSSPTPTTSTSTASRR